MTLDHARPLTRAIVSHDFRELSDDGSDSYLSYLGRRLRGNKWPVLVQLDKIVAAKTIATLATSAGFLRGHGIFHSLFSQSTVQLTQC